MARRHHLIACAGAVLSLALSACAASRRQQPAAAPPAVLIESWHVYVAKFIQKDGRVIDRHAGDISTSEGQAYALLRAVWMDDRPTFEKVYGWAVNNLNAGVRQDRLWAWKWGRAPDGKWRALDRAFATDADEDAALALLLAARNWKEPRFLAEARATIADLWRLATVKADGRRQLLAGDSLCKGKVCRVNPSYCAPYAYRMFREADPGHDWNALVDSCYDLLDSASELTATRLPPDWVEMETVTGALRRGTARDSNFSYDALRAPWRVALDYELFQEPRAALYLKRSLAWLDGYWKRTGKLPAVITGDGRPAATYESLEMMAALAPALRLHYPEMAKALGAKLQNAYSNGAWADHGSYYLQNWAWFGTALDLRYLDPLR
jgi:endoglucanase